MEYDANKIINKLKGILKWSERDKDTAIYREIEVLLKYYEIVYQEELNK